MAEKPNLLFIFTDQQATNTIGAYGNTQIDTPNTDRLAAESALFQRAYITQPVCTPSRSSIMTGLYPHTNGCVRNNVPLRADTPCFPEIGDWSGYTTAYYGKWHLGDEVFRQHGFDDWRSTEEYETHYSADRDPHKRSDYAEYLASLGYEPDVVDYKGTPRYSRGFATRLPEEHGKPAFLAQESCRFLRENKNNPFVLYINFLEPHSPYNSPRDGQYNPADMPVPESFYREPEGPVPLRYQVTRRSQIEDGKTREEDWQDVIARYWGLASLVDTHVGRILDTFRELGLDENTIIVYISDHGSMMGAHGHIAKGTMYEEAVRVPLLIRIPGMSGGVQIEHPVGQVDLVPTLLDAMGRDIPSHLEGFSLLPFLRGESNPAEENVFIEWNGLNGGMEKPGWPERVPDYWSEFGGKERIVHAYDDHVRTIITPDRWKYCWSRNGEDELYNHDEDPHELRNLAQDDRYRSLISELRAKTSDWQARTSDDLVLPGA